MAATPGLSTVLPVAVGTQPVMSAVFEFDLASAQNQIVNTVGATVNLKAVAVVAKIINLPTRAMVVGGEMNVRTVSNDTGTHTLAVGDSASASRYLAATNIKAAARTPLVPTTFVGAGEGIQITLAAGTGDATAGVVRIRIEYVIDNRTAEVQTY
jgi:hypothetical protein